MVKSGTGAVLNRIPGSKANTEIDASVARQEYITKQALDEHELRAFGPKSLLKQKLQIVVDVVPIDPNVRSSEPI